MNEKLSFDPVNFCEKRSTRRINFSEPVIYKTKIDSQISANITKDLSESGLRFTSNQFIGVGTQIFLTISLNDGTFVEVIGAVAWVEKMRLSDKYQLGIKFEETSSYYENKNQINRIINKL